MKTRAIIIIIICLLSVNFMGIAQVSRLKLIAYYPFNGNAQDASGNGNNATIINALLTTDRFGNENSAYEFNGFDNYISIPNAPILQITGEISMSAWFKTPDALDFAGILCKANPAEPRVGYMLGIDDNDKVRVDLLVDHSTSQNVLLVSDKTVTDDKWHLVVATYDGSIVKLYVDGILNKTANYTSGMRNNNEPLLIGWDENTWMSHRHFYGKIDEVMIFNRILEQTEVSNLYNQPKATINGTLQVCQGQKNVSYNVSDMQDIAGYEWSYTGTGATITGSSANISIDFSDNASSGFLKAIGNKTCDCGKDSAFFTVTVNQLPDAIVSANSPVCSGSTINLNSQFVPSGIYHWTGPNGYTSQVQNPVILSASDLHEGNYFLTVSVNSCNSAPANLSISVQECAVNDLSILMMVSNSIPVFGQTLVFTIAATNTGSEIVSGVNVFDLIQDGYSYVSSTASTGSYNPVNGIWDIGEMKTGTTQILTLTVSVKSTGNYANTALIQGDIVEANTENNFASSQTDPSDFNIPNSFSPNGDGINELFVIRGLFGNSRLMIFDRLGKKVYESEDYQNDWDGKDLHGTILDSDTYWYVLTLQGMPSDFKGFVYLKK